MIGELLCRHFGHRPLPVEIDRETTGQVTTVWFYCPRCDTCIAARRKERRIKQEPETIQQKPEEMKQKAVTADAGEKKRVTTTLPDRTAVATDLIDRWCEKYRKDNGRFFSKRELAKKIGYHENLIYQWKSGTYTPTWALINKAATFFGVTVDDFLAGPEEEKTCHHKGLMNQTSPHEKPEAATNRQITPHEEMSISLQYIGDILDEWMEARVLSHEDVSNATGITRHDLSRLIGNQIRATGDEIYRLAGTFRVTVDEFLAGPTEEDYGANEDKGGKLIEGTDRYELHAK